MVENLLNQSGFILEYKKLHFGSTAFDPRTIFSRYYRNQTI